MFFILSNYKVTNCAQRARYGVLGLCSPLAMLDGSRFSCHATIIEHDMELMSIAKK